MTPELSIAIKTATSCQPPDSISTASPFPEAVVDSISALGVSARLISVEDFKSRYYDEKWKRHGVTAFHPERLPDLWTPAASYNWILLGSNPSQAIAVVNGQINPAHKAKRFKVLNLIEIQKKEAEKQPLERDKSPPATPIAGTRCTPARNPGEPAPGGVQPVPIEEDTRRLEGDALGYAAWALDCLRRKQYADAQTHLITALRRSNYYNDTN